METQKQEKITSAPVSVRMTQDTNERFKALSSEFGFANQNQAMEGLIAAFELQQARNLIPSRAKEIEEFADHTKRLNDIYLNALELNINTEDFIRKEYSQRLETQQGVIQSQQEQITTLKSTTADLTAQLKESQKSLIESEKSIKVAEAQTLTQSQLIAEYKEKNEALSSIITKNQAALDQVEQVKVDYRTLQNEFTSYKAQVANEIVEQNRVNDKQINELIKGHDKQLTDLNKKIDQAETATERLAEKYQVAVERAKEQSDLALEKLTNKLQAQYQEKLQAIHDQHNQQVAELLQKLQPQKTAAESNAATKKNPMESVMNNIKDQAPDLIK